MIRLLAGVFLGWVLGANDAAKAFGAAVSTQMISYRTAAIFSACFAILGAIIDGGNGLKTLGNLTTQTADTAFIVCLAAGMVITLLTALHLPASASQAVVGGILGLGFIQGRIHWLTLEKVVVCWLLTPVGAALISSLSFLLLGRILFIMNPHFLKYDSIMRISLFLVGCYSAYSIGANNVANTTGLFFKAGMLSLFEATLLGGISIALGSLTFSRGVMRTLFSRMLRMDAFSAFIMVFSEALTLHIFALIGVPVSIAQAATGAALGLGIIKNYKLVNLTTLYQILLSWLLAPGLALVFTLSLGQIFLVGRP